MLYRFQIELSDIDRGIYESLDFRVAQHPSEAGPYLLSRVLAYALSYQSGLEFSPLGLGDPEAPALRVLGRHNAIDTWIEIGNPSARKLHKASKSAKNVKVYTYKNPQVLLQDLRGQEIHRSEEIKIQSFEPKFLDRLEKLLEKNNKWSILIQQGQLDIESAGTIVSTEIQSFKIG